MEKTYWVYILASALGGTLYVGVTNDLVRRIYEHRMGLAEGFTKKYEVHRLVYFEQYHDVEMAIRREKRLKKWNRAWKIRLIEGQPGLGRPLPANRQPLSLGRGDRKRDSHLGVRGVTSTTTISDCHAPRRRGTQ